MIPNEAILVVCACKPECRKTKNIFYDPMMKYFFNHFLRIMQNRLNSKNSFKITKLTREQ